VRSDAGPRHSREFLSAYISGYVDGEGCFTVSISPRAKLKAGWEVRPSLSVSQNGDRAEVLHAIQAYFGCGSLFRIVELARVMNPSGKRRYDAEAILERLRQGEGIVCASGNGGFTRSSDLHEWRNDLGTVSTRDPVKL
jgi:hypothetical protein